MVTYTAHTVAGLADVDLRDPVIVVLADKVVDTRAINSGQLLGLCEQRVRNDIGRHSG